MTSGRLRKREVGEFLPLPFTDHTCYEKGTREGQNGRKKLLLLEKKSVMFWNYVFPYNNSFLGRYLKEGARTDRTLVKSFSFLAVPVLQFLVD